MRLSYDKIFKPLYPQRSESAHCKSSSLSFTPVRDKILVCKKKNNHQRTNSQIVKQKTPGRMFLVSPQRENIKPDGQGRYHRQRPGEISNTASTKGHKSMNKSFKFSRKTAGSSREKSKTAKFVRNLFLSN
jgi:hypothetical protein